MLVEHVGGLYLEHSLTGAVLSPGYGPEYAITHVRPSEDFCQACTLRPPAP